MGSGSAKPKQQIQISQVKLDLYDQIMSKQNPISPSSIQSTPIVSTVSQHFSPMGKILSPGFLIDQSQGYPVTLSIQSSSFNKLQFPLSAGSRCLCISQSAIIITSLKGAFLVSIPSLKKTPLPPMQVPRENHSIVNFNQRVLVTGGGTESAISHCEMLNDDKWEQIPGLNKPRHWHSSIFHLDAVYVFGGLQCKSIEKLQGKWELLNVELPWNINRIGLAPISNRILIVGGEVVGEGYSVAGWEFCENKLIQVRNCPLQGVFYSQGGYTSGNAVLVAGGLVLMYHEAYKTWGFS